MGRSRTGRSSASAAAPQPVIFVVDDDEEARASLLFLARSMGAACQGFAAPRAFLDSYAGERGCIVSDVRMPSMTGLEFQDALIERGITLPLLLITAYPEVALAVRAMKRGALTLLEKPCRDSELWEEIQAAIHTDLRNHQRRLRFDDTTRRLAKLSQEERQVLELVMEGTPSKTIARRLGISLRTVETRRSAIFSTLNVESLAELVRVVVEHQQSSEWLRQPSQSRS